MFQGLLRNYISTLYKGESGEEPRGVCVREVATVTVFRWNCSRWNCSGGLGLKECGVTNSRKLSGMRSSAPPPPRAPASPSD